MPGRIVIIAEVLSGQVMPVTYELVGLAHTLGGTTAEIVALGPDIGPAARELAARTGAPVTAIEPAAPYTAEAWMDILAGLFAARMPDLLLAVSGVTAQDYLPGLAVRLKAACITEVQSCTPTPEGRLTFTRAAMNGKVLMDITPPPGPIVAAIKPGCLAAWEGQPTGPGPIATVACPQASHAVIPLGTFPPAHTDDERPLGQAEVIVAAGRGIGRPENLGLIRRLAQLFARAAVAGSRPLCDMGWLPYARQVGLTGATVTPKLYLACGISGSPQHIAGMHGAQLIVAINKDPQAAIFQTAHVGVVGDLREIIPLILTEYGRRKAPDHLD